MLGIFANMMTLSTRTDRRDSASHGREASRAEPRTRHEAELERARMRRALRDSGIL